MELQRGVCSLCWENGKVFTPSGSQEISKFLPGILYENFLTEAEFQKIKDSIKICIICCSKIQAANETRRAIENAEENSSDLKRKNCHFCKNGEYVVKVRDDWNYFVSRTEGFLKITDFPVCVCPRCVFYFDTIFNIKTNLTKKFPQLAVPTKPAKSPLKQNDTPKRKSLSKSPPSSKKRKIFNNCFSYLQPLCNNNYYVDSSLKKDTRLYKKIAYVNLKDVKNVNIKETPKVRPIIKIKLKARTKKGPREKLTSKVATEYSEESDFKTQPYVKLCKSEEISSKFGSQKSKARRYSCHLEERPIEKEPDENLEETPKAASAANLVPKRRVSLFVEPNEADSEEKLDTPVNSEKIDKIVEKYINDSTFNDNNKLDLLEEIGDKVNSPIEENGIEKPTQESEDLLDTEIEQSNKEEKSEENSQDTNEDQKSLENERSERSESSLSKDSDTKASSKSADSSDSSDSEASDKLKSKGNDDRDSLNGSERKKKRVTFSDEIN